MDNELERMWKEAPWPNLRHYPDILWSDLGKSRKPKSGTVHEIVLLTCGNRNGHWNSHKSFRCCTV
jgi:hypothetical protein